MRDAVTDAMKRLDALGATYRTIPGHSGWYEARWPDKDAPKGYGRWACQDDARDPERSYALAFKSRAES